MAQYLSRIDLMILQLSLEALEKTIVSSTKVKKGILTLVLPTETPTSLLLSEEAAAS